jgi:hypothetical protein
LRIKNPILIFSYFFFCILSVRSQNAVHTDESNQTNNSNYNFWYDYFGITEEDSLDISFPIEYSFEFILDDLIGVETNKIDYLIKSTIVAFHNFEDIYVLKSNDTITLDPEYFNAFEIVYPENEHLFRGEWSYNGRYDSVSQYSRYFESELYHNWDMRSYPFDIQRLKFRIESVRDTSLVRLSSSKEFPPHFGNVNSLKRGFQIDTIIFNESFVESSAFNLDVDRNEVYSNGTFEILLSRKNSWLFVKLFSGGILSLFLAWMSVFIPRKKGESRIELSIGSIFAAVGNKYFVDSAISSEVLTTADVINNLVIVFVVLNTGYLVWQMRRKAKSDSFSPVSVFVVSFLCFIATVSISILI